MIAASAGAWTRPAEATFDNFELRTYEIPPLGIQRAMRLTWPAPAGLNWAVEGAHNALPDLAALTQDDLDRIKHATRNSPGLPGKTCGRGAATPGGLR